MLWIWKKKVSKATGGIENWESNFIRILTGDYTDSLRSHPPPTAPQISEWDKSILTSTNILECSLDYRICKKCDRPVLNSSIAWHIDYACPSSKYQLEKTKRAMTDSMPNTEIPGDDSPSPVKASQENQGDSDIEEQEQVSLTASGRPRKKYKKKRQADGEATPPKAKKAKKEKSKPVPKAKAPVDVEKQCGVPISNGQLCARSLTCKSHSMGAKRAVVGRSAPYDVLLANYQRKNQVKLASLSTAQQLADENEALGGSVPINTEEEIAQVMEGVRRTVIYPIKKKVIMPTRLKTQFIRMREMLASSLLPMSGSSSTGLHGRANAFDPLQPEQLHFMRPPAIQRAAYLKQQHQQQQAAAAAAAAAQNQTQPQSQTQQAKMKG